MTASTPTSQNIWILCGGPSTEFDVSLSSGRFVAKHIDATNRRVTPAIVTRTGHWIIPDQTITENAPRDWIDPFFQAAAGSATPPPALTLAQALALMATQPVHCAFLAFHGQYGEDGAIQGLLQTAGIPYTGSGILASALAFNKTASLQIFANAGLPTARHVICTHQNPAPSELDQLTYPLFTKPVRGGSSLGVSLVKSADALQAGIAHALAHDTHALAEEKIPGVEVSCGVIETIENGRIIARALPPTLISPGEAEFFDYDAKYTPGKSNDITPAPLPAPLIARIQEIALAAHNILGCEGMSRTDLITQSEPGSEPVILETQTLPGMTPTSLIPQQCAAFGITFAQFIEHIIKAAQHRHQITLTGQSNA